MVSSHKPSNFYIKLIRILLQFANRSIRDVHPLKVTALQLVSTVASATEITTGFASHLLLHE